jgi:C4-dicarboxylate transporter DctM subunit
MEPAIAGALGFVALFLLLAAGMPIGFAMALVGFVGFIFVGGIEGAFGLLGSVPFSTAASYILSVIPMFVLMGEFSFVSGMVTDAYKSAYSWLGHLPGGLAMATIGGCTAFAACCGSSLAGASLMAEIAYPEMTRYRYGPRLALGSIAAGGTLAILIPPSTAFIIYGILAEVSIGALFIAGILPGIFLATLFMLAIYTQARLDPTLGPPGPKNSWHERFVAVKDVWLVLLLFLLVLGSIWGGILTPTEAGGIGAFGAFIIALGKKRLTRANTVEALGSTLRTTAMLFTILIGAMIFNYFLAVTRVPSMLADFVAGLNVPPLTIVVAILLVYAVLGCIMDTLAMIVLTIPIFVPIVSNLGFDLVWFGVIVTVMLEMALITPPIGMNVFVVSGTVRGVSMYTIFRGIVPFIAAMMVCIAVLLFFPELSLFLPSTIIH